MCDVPSLSALRPDVPPALAAAIDDRARAPNVEDRWTTADRAGANAAARGFRRRASGRRGRAWPRPWRALFGSDAAERRLAAVTTPSEATAANLMLPPPDVPSQPQPRVSPLRPRALDSADRDAPASAAADACRRCACSGRCWRCCCRRAGCSSASVRRTRAARSRPACCRRDGPAPTALPAPTLPQLKLVPRALHLAAPPAGPGAAVGAAAPAAAQKPTSKPRRHNRQRRTHRVATDRRWRTSMIAAWRAR